MRKPALVVDDSRVAALSLRRLLERQGLPVDIVESGVEALEYLRSNVLPSVVFLDYMMPGMDGFEALSAIKTDARLTAIPVVMYTSHESDAYVGQALARGAYAVLRKPLRAAELRLMLQRLELLPQGAPERGRASEPERMPIPITADAVGTAAAPADERRGGGLSAPGPAPVESAGTAPDERPDVALEPAAAGGRRPWVLAALVVAALGLWYFALEGPNPENAPRPQTLPPAQARAPTAAAAPSKPDAGALVDVISWALNLQNHYAYNQLPLDDQRLALVRDLVGRLAQADFRGVVRLDTHVGEFCLARDGFGGFKLPEAVSRISECEVVEHTAQEAAALGRRQSPAFMRYLANPSPDRGNIRIEVVSHGNERPVIAYPHYATTETAGEWNAVAQRNNRVHISIIPARAN